MRGSALLACALLGQAMAFKPTFKPPVKPSFKQPMAVVGSAVLPFYNVMPVHAVGSAEDLDGLAGPLTAGIGLFLLVIGGFAASAASEVADQAETRMDRLGIGKNSGSSRGNPKIIYEDVDYSYKSLSKPVQNSRDRKVKSKQFGKDGKRLAPWMVIDEDRIAKTRKARAENKRKTGKFFG